MARRLHGQPLADAEQRVDWTDPLARGQLARRWVRLIDGVMHTGD